MQHFLSLSFLTLKVSLDPLLNLAWDKLACSREASSCCRAWHFFS